METNTAAKWYRWVTAVYLLAVLSLCVINFGPMSKVPSRLLDMRTDLIIHFVMFIPMPFLFFGVYSTCVSLPSLWGLAIIFLICVFLASFTEVMQQYLIPWRTGELSDLVADTIGISAGGLITVLHHLKRSHHNRRI